MKNGKRPSVFFKWNCVFFLIVISIAFGGKSIQAAPLPLQAIGDEQLRLGDVPRQNQSAVPESLSKNSNGTLLSAFDGALAYCEIAQALWEQGDIDNALEALDEAYALVLSVNTMKDENAARQKDDLRFLISKRIMEIYASRAVVAKGRYSAIPLDMNEEVQAQINRFAGPERRFFIASYQRAGMYMPMIQKELKVAGLPEELIWLPLIESGYKTQALSPARALGLWQFIPSTGYKFGLERTLYVDERLDPEKSTRAAIAYLRELHGLFGDWSTALAAYNCGEGRVLRTIRDQNINYLDNFWDLYRKLPRETAQYVPRFLAVLHILKDPRKYGFTSDELQMLPPIKYETMSLNQEITLRSIAAALNVSESDLRTLNPELRNNIVPPQGYALRIPIGKSKLLASWLQGAPADTEQIAQVMPQSDMLLAMQTAAANQTTPIVTITHTVSAGEGLYGLARIYGTSVPDIMALNNLPSKELTIGQKLQIPKGSALQGVAVTKAAQQVVKARSAPKTYVVKKGDTLSKIAQKNGTTMAKLIQLNGLKKNGLVQIGQTLKIQ